MGQTLANHSYVDLSLVGTSDSNGLQCITDLHTCCSSSQGAHRGDWYFPNGSMLRFSGDVFEVRGAQRVDLCSGVSPSHGIYCCAISTNVVHDDYDISVRGSFCVGLYPSNEGAITISRVVFNYSLKILTCISTG
ncbi:hypothetical protein GBAR_LOCUS20966, partial [Geodia barretti]